MISAAKASADKMMLRPNSPSVIDFVEGRAMFERPCAGLGQMRVSPVVATLPPRAPNMVDLDQRSDGGAAPDHRGTSSRRGGAGFGIGEWANAALLVRNLT